MRALHVLTASPPHRLTASPPMQLPAGASIVLMGLVMGGLVACSQQPQASGGTPTRSMGAVVDPPPGDTLPPVPRDTTPDARPKLARLEQEARALAKTEGCASVGACRSAPMGWRGCGGPRTYVVYCAATTDTVALFKKLAGLEQAEREYNATAGMMSTCEFRMPPSVKLEARSCRPGPAVP